MRRWFGVVLAAGAVKVGLVAQVPDLELPRAGSIVVTELTGDVATINDEQRRTLKLDDRVRVGSIINTGRKSLVAITLSNGASVQLGAETEVEVEEFGQAAVASSTKISELKAEPSLSRTRLKLVRGDVAVTVKALNVTRGSTFTLALIAGTLRLAEGSLRAMVRMHDLGLGVCTLELQAGAGEFEAVGSRAFAPIPLGRKLAFAVEMDKNGGVKIGEMPKETPKTK